MEVCLGVTACDKCGKTMKKDQSIIVIAEGLITRSEDDLDFEGSSVRYACHLNCWNGVEES